MCFVRIQNQQGNWLARPPHRQTSGWRAGHAEKPYITSPQLSCTASQPAYDKTVKVQRYKGQPLVTVAGAGHNRPFISLSRMLGN